MKFVLRILTHPGVHPVEHTHTHTHTCTCTVLEQWAANYSARGAWGYGALLKSTSAVTRRWTATPPALSPPILFLSGERGSNRQPSGQWTATLTTEPRPPNWATAAHVCLIVWLCVLPRQTEDRWPTLCCDTSTTAVLLWLAWGADMHADKC